VKDTVYVETSVISYFTSKPSRDLVIAGRQEITREKWPKIIEIFDLYVSALVIQEAEQGDSNAAHKRIDAILDLPVLAISDEAEKLASILIKDGAIPGQYPEDALHISICNSKWN